MALLPVLAALFVQGPAQGRVGQPFNVESMGLLLQHHWFWLAVGLGLGVWVGWHAAAGRGKRAEAKTP